MLKDEMGKTGETGFYKKWAMIDSMNFSVVKTGGGDIKTHGGRMDVERE